MRAGGCTVQQALTSEAASVVKQAVTLARRRGHAQVTPLHVANTMLAVSAGLLRTACLQSHSHPLQCKALELCFNVALNRLPASTSTPMLGGSAHSQYPTISNALVAAFKRAQAHQRRGSVENQQQPLLAVKIELEQLIISILDDPSVSRVMREAGFSSTQVKSNVEQSVSLDICSQSTPLSSSDKSKESNKVAKPRVSSSDPIIRNEDIMYVIENLMSSKRKRNFVIVGECLASIEGLVRVVIDKIEKGDIHEALRDVKFIKLSLSSFRHMNRLEVEQKVEEIKNLVRSCNLCRGVVLNLGDLEWAEFRASSSEQVRGYYCSIEHIIVELGKLVSGIGENTRFWLMGIATFKTYMRCKSGHPSLETLLGLHPLTVPADNLCLSLITIDSNLQNQSTSKTAESGASWLLFEGGEENKQLTCCAHCSAKFEAEARSLQRISSNSDSPTSSLPAWLQQYKNENKAALSNNDKDSGVRDLCKKWNSICSSIHKQPYHCERTLTFSSVSPSSSTSGFLYEKTDHDWAVVEPKHSWREHHFLFTEASNNKSTFEPSLRLYIPEHNDLKPPFSPNPNSTPNSTSSRDIMEMEYVHKFKELNSENLTTLCNALERKVPWQKDIVPDIASTVLKCRSGMTRRKGKVKDVVKEETWLFFQGVDAVAKEKIAKELARLVFGSHNKYISIALSRFSSSTKADSTEDSRNKRSRDEQSCSNYIERFAEAVSNNPHRVFLMEDVEQADYFSQKRFKRAIESGRITYYSNGANNEVNLGDAIIILSCESFSSRSRACSPPIRQKTDGSEEEKVTSPSVVSLDLKICIGNDSTEDQPIDDIGLFESVDKRINFKIMEL